MTSERRIGGSFRDPSGFLFERDGVLYRQVTPAGEEDYRALMDTGLYEALVREDLLVAHEEVDEAPHRGDAVAVLRPERIPFISYPYEWCFSQLKEAALATLRIQRLALEHGVCLKDASAYNIQFPPGKGPVLIDTLSFERYEDGKPWVAYQQFCKHFLAPLALMARADIRLQGLLRLHIDGVPLDLASRLLPRRTRFSPGLLFHIHMAARAQTRYADNRRDVRDARVSRQGLEGILMNLGSTIKRLGWEPSGTEWADYYNDTNYTEAAAKHKEETIQGFLDRVKPSVVWDIGSNNGRYSRLASRKGIPTISMDLDPSAVERNHLDARSDHAGPILPLVQDLTNPSPDLGWRHHERMSLLERGPVDLIMALALVHHLAIGNNVPLDDVAGFIADGSRRAIVEFVPKEDSQVQRLLRNREDVFPDYTVEGFEAACDGRFEILEKVPLRESTRILYLLERVRGDAA